MNSPVALKYLIEEFSDDNSTHQKWCEEWNVAIEKIKKEQQQEFGDMREIL